MNIKGKIVLIGICIIIIITVFTARVINRMNENSDYIVKDTKTQENVISRAEAYRLLSYLSYTKSEREALPMSIYYLQQQDSGWYDTYVNAVCSMGLIDKEINFNPVQALTYGGCKELIDQLILSFPEYQMAYSGLSFEFTKADEMMQIQDFLELYEALIKVAPEEEKLVSNETIFVLGREISEDGKDRMVTDIGKYYYQNVKDYEFYYKLMGQTASTDTSGASKVETVSSPEELLQLYVDKGIKALVCDQELIYITGLTTEPQNIQNVWIEQGKNLELAVYINGIHKKFSTQYKIGSDLGSVVGDITIENQKVTKISVKPDLIKGKVLQSTKDYIEIEGYGKIPLEEQYRIYKVYDELSMEPTGSILVGYENTQFVVSSGKISAALITQSIKAENIRVLINTTGYTSMYHKRVKLTATSDFTITYGDKVKKYKKGDTVNLKSGASILKEERAIITPTSENGKVKLLSVERSSGNPKYRGRIEISQGEEGLLIINELPMEEYLYSVIPSEMPSSYGAEALKVQAISARSYAYKHLLANSLSNFGAHVDDSVSYQVYNNLAENEDTILAVKDTYGKVVEYEDEVITAYYYSTSCGHSATAANVWSNNSNLPYLESKLLVEDGEGADPEDDLVSKYEDLSSEKVFSDFIEDEDLKTYDSEFSWYRWKVTMKVKEIKKQIDDQLAKRYQASPELILTQTKKDDKGNPVFESVPVDSIGNIVDIIVEKRESSGIVTELRIVGSEHTVIIKREYNIRALLAPVYDTIIRQDKSEVDGLKLLPSAFFTIKKEQEDGMLSGITLVGGGYGHGVGMSQNGVKALADSGKEAEEIISYFYKGTELGFIYE